MSLIELLEKIIPVILAGLFFGASTLRLWDAPFVWDDRVHG